MPTKDEIIAALEDLQEAPEEPDVVDISRRRLSCPVCGETMRLERQGRVVVDVCPAHGMWLDRDEVLALLAPSHNPGFTQERLDKARREGKISGILLGSMSLLFD